jgi:hypothetical protein
VSAPAEKCSACGTSIAGAALYASTGEVVCAACEAGAKDRQIEAGTARDKRSKTLIIAAAVGALALILIVAGLLGLKACVSTSGPL